MPDISGTNVAAPVRPYNTECTYPTAFADEIAGGLKYVVHESALSTITPERRPVGTIVSVGFGKFRQWTGSDWKAILQGADPPKVEYTNSDVQLKFTETIVSLKAATANSAGIFSATMFSRLMGHGKKHLQDGDDAIASTVPRADTVPQADKTGKIASGWLAFAGKGLAGLVQLADDGQAPQDEAGAAPFVVRANDSRLAQITALKSRLDAFSNPIRYVDQLPAKASALASTFYCVKNTGALYLFVDNIWLPVGNGPQGEAGKTAYEVAQVQGYEGSIDQWLEGLRGANGQDGIDGNHGKSAYELARDDGFTGTISDWLDSLTGKDGKQGVDGKSAYRLATDEGFVGTLPEWIESLRGRNGEDGATGKNAYELAVDAGFIGSLPGWFDSLKGQNGEDGKPGKNAYELAVNEGFSGSLPNWLLSLKGEKGNNGEKGEKGDPGAGKSAYQLAVEEGFSGSLYDWFESLRGRQGETGTNGKSAYQQALDDGFSGTLTEWLASLVGRQGDRGIKGEKGEDGDGKSAYTLAVEEGFTGSLTDWLASLYGRQGDPGSSGKSSYQLALDDGFEGSLTEWLQSLVGRQGDQGVKGEKGEDGRGIEIQAYYDSLEDFLAVHETGEDGDCYGVAGNLYVWTGDHWENVGKLIGASAFEVWLEQPGNYGKTFDDFFDELAERAFSEAELATLIQMKVTAWLSTNVVSVLAPIVNDWLNQNLEPLLAVRLPSQLETSFNTHVSKYHEWQPIS